MPFELVVIFGLIVANGLFAGAEIAIVGVDRARLRQLIDDGVRRARAVQALRKNPERFFATVQIVITVVGATAGALGGASFAGQLAPVFEPIFGAYADEVSFAAVVGVVSFLSLVVGELVPKSLALRHAESYALIVAPVLLWVSSAARPLVWLLTASSNAVLRFFGDKTTFTEARLSPEELRELVEEAAEVGSLDARVSEFAARAFDFGRLTASHSMIPRTRVVGIPRDASPDEVRRIVVESPHTRIPVYENDLDHITGYILTKDLLAPALEQRTLRVQELIRKTHFVAETASLPDVFDQMRARRTHLVVVVDERGGTSGIVTMDDLLEELVGEVKDEHDRGPPVAVRRLANGTATVRGDMPIREVNRELDIELPEGDAWSTVGGLCMALAEGVPKPGQVLQAPDGTELVVEAATERAVTQVRITPPKSDEAPEGKPEPEPVA